MRTFIIGTALVLMASGAVAQEITQPGTQASMPASATQSSTLTRAQVMAEVAGAERAGKLNPTIDVSIYQSPPASTLTRAQVMADVAAAQRNGSLNMQGEITQEPPLASATSSESAAQLRAEARQAEVMHATNSVYGDTYQN